MLSAPTGRTVPRPRWERTLAALRVLLTLGFLLALFFAFGLTPNGLAAVIGHADGLPLALALVVLAVAMVLLAVKWYVIARALGIGVTFASATRLYLTSMVLNSVLPTAVGGDLYRAYVLSRQTDTRLKRSLASVIIERATGYAGLLVLSAPAAAFYFVGALAGVAVTLALLILFAIGYLTVRRLGDPNSVGEGNDSRRWGRLPFAPSYLYLVAVLSVAQQSVWVSVAAILGLAYDVSVPWSYWALAVTALTLLTVLPISLGGLGLREVGYVAILAPLDVEASKAAAISLLMGFGPSLVSLAGLLVFAASGLRRRRSSAPPTMEAAASEPSVTRVER